LSVLPPLSTHNQTRSRHWWAARTWVRVGIVEGNNLNTHEIVAWGNARRHCEVVPAAVCDQGVDGPLVAVQAILGHLEPLEAARAGRRGIADLGEVDNDRTWRWAGAGQLLSVGGLLAPIWVLLPTLVAGRDGVVGVVGSSCSANLMSPPSSNSGSSWDRNHRVVLVLDIGVAGKVPMVDVLDGVVGAWSTNSLKLALLGSVDRHLLEYGVGVCQARQGKNSR